MKSGIISHHEWEPMKMARKKAPIIVGVGITLAACLGTLAFVPYISQSMAAVAADPLPSGAAVRPVDGGAQYFSRFPNSLPSSSSFFPVGVWFESVLTPTDVPTDRAAGINSYIELTKESDLQAIRSAGMFAIPSWASPLASARLLSDEADMWAGAGTSVWTGTYPGAGTVCAPAESKCGYTVQETLLKAVPPNTLTYSNYGKGITFWESAEEAGKFVNSYQQIVSADTYWFTDPNICAATEGGVKLAPPAVLPEAECRKAANYGWTVDRVRSFVNPKGNIPVWAFVELGHPFTDANSPTITAPEIRAAVWSSIIHGARGIVYFNHNFGGPCLSQHVLRDSCGAAVRPMVTSVNQQIIELAPVLNAPFVDGVASVTGSIDVAVKAYNGGFYLIAGSTKAASQSVSVTMKCGGGTSVTVLGENRTLSISGGTFADTFADSNAVHLYRIDGGNSCGV